MARRHGLRVPEGSAPRGRDWAVRGRAAAGPARRPAPGRGDRVAGEAGRGVPLPPHRSGEPEPQRAEKPATDGRAAMADVEGESVSWRWRGERQALAATHARSPRPSETPEVNHSPRPPQLLLCSPPPPPQQLITKHPLRSDSAAAPGLLGNVVQSSTRAVGLCLTTNYHSQ